MGMDGFISVDELFETLQTLHFPGEKLTRADAAEMVKVFDIDFDGRISFDDFEALMKR